MFVESHLGFLSRELSSCAIFTFSEKGKPRHGLATPQQIRGRSRTGTLASWLQSGVPNFWDPVEAGGLGSGTSWATTSCVVPDKSLNCSVLWRPYLHNGEDKGASSGMF